MDVIQEGMRAVASDGGTAAGVFADYPVPVAAKTGTVQTSAESEILNNGVFVCYAPADDPEIAISLVVEKGTSGATIMEIAKDIMKYYFSTKRRSPLSKITRSFRNRPGQAARAVRFQEVPAGSTYLYKLSLVNAPAVVYNGIIINMADWRKTWARSSSLPPAKAARAKRRPLGPCPPALPLWGIKHCASTAMPAFVTSISSSGCPNTS
jgi:hypothetical protein